MKTRLREQLNVGTWEKGKFFHTRRELERMANGDIQIGMDGAVEQVKPARLTRARRQQADSPLTAQEASQLRSIVWQLLWCTRCLFQEWSFSVSELSGKMSAPVVADLLKANVLVRRLQQLEGKRLILRADLDVRTAAVVCSSDASFGTMDKDRSQHGHATALVDRAIEGAAVGQLMVGSVVDWLSGRIRRVCRSTPATETFGVSEGSANGQWIRSMLDEVVLCQVQKNHRRHITARRLILVTDCKAMCDHLSAERGAASDKRVALELSLLRGEVGNCNMALKWVPTTHQLADVMTKEATVSGERTQFLSRVLKEGLYTLGPDKRAPTDYRGRSIAAEFEHQKEQQQ